jgi:hypothetical protein
VKRRSPWLIVLLVLGLGFMAVVGLIVLVAAAGAFFLYTAEEQPFTDKDRQVVVTVDDLMGVVEDFSPDHDAETTGKSKYIDKSYEIEYEYEHPDEDQPLFLHSSVSVEPSVSDAKTTYMSVKMGMSIGLSASGEDAQLVDRDDLFQWGDESRCALVTSGGFNVGNFFVARKGTRVFCLMITGHAFDDRESLEKLVKPKLERLESYSP